MPDGAPAPMLASLGDAPLQNPHLVYEPKYDGIRAIVEIDPAARTPVRLWSRLGNEKTAQFPEVADALARWARRLKRPLTLDGEIVALTADGEPTGFQQLQGRIHLAAGPGAESSATAYIAFDLLRDGSRDLCERPLTERRAALESLFRRTGPGLLRISEQVSGDGRALYQRALDHGWEGLIAKRADSLYKAGKRTPDWCKIKIVQEQEFVVGGWTDPRHARTYFGALLLGVYDSGRLVYVGHTGTGFNERELARVMKLLRPLETHECPFVPRPRTNERPHWTKPELVAQIKFTEWTADGKLRHPVYLGLRDDKRPTDIVREATAMRRAARPSVAPQLAAQPPVPTPAATSRARMHAARTTAARTTAARTTTARTTTARTRGSRAQTAAARPASRLGDYDPAPLIEQFEALERARKNGVVTLPGGEELPVTNLHKVFWPRHKLTKGDLFRYYARIAPYILPAVADRPLVMKRYPNGVAAKPFYQHRAETPPAGVRSERVQVQEARSQLIGGDLITLLYMTQLAAISQDPWFSRVQSPREADYVAFDLDPSDGQPFSRVLDVARWVRDELDALGVEGVPKTSGSSGLHIYVALPAGTPYDAGLLFCQIVATVVASKHPKQATVERSVAARGSRVYVDYMQNVLGKTLATAYSARASEYAGVSTPLTWKEVDDGVRREDFTITTVPDRLRQVGDLWEALRRSKGANLAAVERYGSKSSRGTRSR